jgi:hypothetical protein
MNNQPKKYWGDVLLDGANGKYGEKWIKAAALVVNGKIRVHARHHLILLELDAEQKKTPGLKYRVSAQGFMLQDGGFIDRVEALQLASQNGQLRNKNRIGDRLFSEDLWDYSEV